MKKMQDYLERDSERFLSLISKSNSKEAIIKEIRSELDRVLYAYTEQELSDRIKEAANSMMIVAKSSADLLDSNGTSKIYTRKEYNTKEEKGKRSWLYTLFLFFGLLSLLAAGAYIYIYYIQYDTTYYSLALLAVVVLSGIFLYLSGVFSHRVKKENKDDLYAEISFDAKKVYQNIYGMVLVMDKVIDDLTLSETLEKKRELQENHGGVDEKELNLLSQLLESAYGLREEDASREVISEIKYYLHNKHIELVDHNEENDRYFDKMAAEEEITLRPAMLLDGVLLKKGLASGGK